MLPLAASTCGHSAGCGVIAVTLSAALVSPEFAAGFSLCSLEEKTQMATAPTMAAAIAANTIFLLVIPRF
jgi:hypothetical protein